MGKETPTESTTTTFQNMPGAEWAYGQATDYFNAMLTGEGIHQYPGQMVMPGEQEAMDFYSQVLKGLTGQGEVGGPMGGAFNVWENVFSPDFTDPRSLPGYEQNLASSMANRQQVLASQGGYSGIGTVEQASDITAASDMFLQSAMGLQGMQTGLSQFVPSFGAEFAGDAMGAAGLPFARNYAEWLRQVQEQTGGATALGQLGMGGFGAGGEMSTGSEWGSPLGDLAQLYFLSQGIPGK